MSMKKIKEVIVVEGRHDTERLRKYFDCDTIETGGTSLGQDVIDRIIEAKKTRGVIVFTDPDSPGNRIRHAVNQSVGGCKNAFVMKKDARTDKKVGVEHATYEILKEALENVVAVRPAVRRKEQRRFSRTEICNRIGGGVHRCAVVLDGVGRCVRIRFVLLVSHPLIPCSQRCCAVKRFQPAVHADSRPCVHHDSSGR